MKPSSEKCFARDASNEEQVSPKSLSTYKERISTLPQEDGWKMFQPLCLYQGFWCLPFFLEGAMFAQENFQAQPGDIFVCSAPKTGTTWLKALTFATLTRSHFENSTSPLLTKVPHDCIPFLEKDFVENSTITQSKFPLWSTHVPYTSLPESIIDSGCKIIYICRDPKDVFVSLWHFIKKRRPNNEVRISFEDAFELYCNGTSIYGPYLDHVLGYWKASMECPSRVLFLKYEDLMRDTIYYLKKLAEFIEYRFSLEEESEGGVQKIIDLCEFGNLSNLENNKTGKHRPNDQAGGMDNNVFFRKGKVGDWKNHLTFEMAKKLESIMQKKLMGSGLTFNSCLD